MSERLRIYVIDHHVVVRDALARLLSDEPDLVMVGHAGTAGDALRETVRLDPDVVLVELNLPDQEGIGSIAALRSHLPRAKLLVLSDHDDELRVTDALRAGAHGYLVKASALCEVIDGIRRVARGGTPLSPQIAGAILRAAKRPRHEGFGGIDLLTPRERQVMRLLAAGVPTRQTAARLTISPKTVETHRVRIYGKLGCKNTVELTRIAVRTGLIEP